MVAIRQFKTKRLKSAAPMTGSKSGFTKKKFVSKRFGPPAGASAPTFVTASDNFTGTDGSINGRTMSDLTSTWTSGFDAFAFATIVTNALQGSAGGTYCGGKVNTPSFGDNQSASCKIGAVDGYYGPMVRIQPTTNQGYVLWTDGNKTVLKIRVFPTGGSTTGSDLATFSGLTLVQGDTITLKITGTTLEAFQNSTSLGTVTDSTFAHGQPGIFVFDIGVSTDDFSATEV